MLFSTQVEVKVELKLELSLAIFHLDVHLNFHQLHFGIMVQEMTRKLKNAWGASYRSFYFFFVVPLQGAKNLANPL